MHDSLNSTTTLKLNNILLVPQITKNLISISQLIKDNDIVVEFTNKFCFVKDRVKNLIILQGKAEKGLYRLLLISSNKNVSESSTQNLVINVKSIVLNVSIIPLSMISAIISDSNNKTIAFTDNVNFKCLLSASILHQRLGHPNSRVLNHVIQSCSSFKNITGNKACDSCDACESCDACKLGKMHKLHFPVTETKTKHPLEILHTDL